MQTHSISFPVVCVQINQDERFDSKYHEYCLMLKMRQKDYLENVFKNIQVGIKKIISTKKLQPTANNENVIKQTTDKNIEGWLVWILS